MKKFLYCFFALMLSHYAFSQVNSQDNAAMADTFRANGKIYVVAAVLLIIFIGICIYIFYLDKKVSTLEKRLTTKKDLM